MNTLYVGDNLDILREHLPNQSTHQIYCDFILGGVSFKKARAERKVAEQPALFGG